MARAKVVHSDDACTIIFNGDKRSPEPGTGIIKFPGGFIEVSRCTDGSYWAHLAVTDPTNIVGSRVDFANANEAGIRAVADIPHGERINHLAIRVAANVVENVDG